MPKVLPHKTEHKYLQVAEGLEKMIHDEVLRIGDKLPSVRVLSEEYGISMGTAFQAYYLLEGKGLIEARPKSGYYVRFNNKRYPGVPAVSRPESMVNEISTKEMVANVFRFGNDDVSINFALASAPMELLPAAKLNKSVLHALRSSPTSCMHYEDKQGNLELRKQIARLSFNWGGQVNPDEVVVTAGCMEALSISLKAVTNPGDTVAVESPTYFGVYQIIDALGLKAVEISMDPETGIDLACLEDAIHKFNINACVFVPNFNNPLGSCMPDDHKKKLVELITKHRIPLIEDDIYGELYYGKHRPRTCKTYDTEGWVVHCCSISKSLAPGYRIGWCLPGRFLERVLELKMMHNLSGTTLTQAAVAHFLGIGRYEYHLKNLRKALHTQCLRYIQAIMQYFPPDVKVSRPKGGFVVWVELNKEINAYQLYQEAMKFHISIAPGNVFSSQGCYANCIRLSFGKPYDADVEYGLQVLGRLIRKMM
jgi:DNA-binding transcriptional MocR family regulator